MNKKRVILIGILLCIGFIIFLFAAFRNKGAGTVPMVRVEKVIKGDLTEFISSSGQIEPKRKLEIRSRISAQIVALPYKMGDRVQKGDPDQDPPVSPSVLMKLDANDVDAELSAARIRREARSARIAVSKVELEARRAGLEGQRAVLEQEEKELYRKKSLLKSKDISLSEVDLQQSRVDNLKAQLISAEQGLKAAELGLVASKTDLEAADADILQIGEKLKYTTITAPMDGVITQLNVDVGEMATGSLYNPGPVLVEVADLSQMVLVAEVDEGDIVYVRAGQPARVHIQAWPDRIFNGRVVSTALSITRKSTNERYYEVEILLDNKDGEIYSGLTADADIEINIHKNILKIPSQAVVDREVDLLPMDIRETLPETWLSRILLPVVYRYKDGRAIITPIEFGKSDATHTIILSGLSLEDEVIVGPYKVLERLRHLRKVKREENLSMEDAQSNLDKIAAPDQENQGGMRIRIGGRR